MRTPSRAVAAALAQPRRPVATAFLLAMPLFLAAAAPAAPPWVMTLQQVGSTGTAVGTPIRLPCPSAGCETSFQLVIGKQSDTFHLQVSYVATGAYLTIVQRSPNVRAVMDFTTGYLGPIFAPLHFPTKNTRLVKLVVAGSSDASNPVLASGPVFNAKMRPDAYLRVVFQRPPAGGR